MPHAGLAEVLRGADVHVLTSHHDAGPIAVVEAAMAGVPTVGTAVGHVADFADLDPAAAVAIEGRDPAALATAIVDLVADRARRDATAVAARTWATRHDATYTADTFDQLYRRLTGGV